MPMHPSSPYHHVPKEALWRKSVEGLEVSAIDPHVNSTLRIEPHHKIASAGSCFAQRISESLVAEGYNYMVVEKGPAFLSPAELKEHGYGIYSARYGNIYTAMQLLQTFRRAFNKFSPVEPLWQNAQGGFVDPFRSGIEPAGFASAEECLWDRESHLKAVREMFENVDILIFTLGLTESWRSKEDGAVFPNCPGSGLGGIFDPEKHEFHNFTVSEIVEQLELFLNELRTVNPHVSVILTVSPVPLMATFEPRHVLQATTYSKSVLRVACEEIIRRHAHVHYFGSYEIVTASGDSRAYFQPDRRNVTPEAVKHVIQCFKRQFIGEAAQQVIQNTPVMAAKAVTASEPMCDEEKVMAALAAHEHQ